MTSYRPRPKPEDPSKSDLEIGELFVTALLVVICSFVTAVLILFVFLLFNPAGYGWAYIFRRLWFLSFIFWAWIGKDSNERERERKLVEEKAKNEAARKESSKQEWQSYLQAQAEKRRLEAMELERQQGIYFQNRMNERMRETGLPRMAANAIDFEVLASQWTYVWGDSDVEVTSQSHDSGIDVQSWSCLGQVKFYSNGKVGAPEVQQLRGATSVDNSRFATFFTFSTGYTNEAIIFADQAGVALFQFDVGTLTFFCVNVQAETVLNHLHSLL